MITIYHNPRCTKSRCALEVIADKPGLVIREYLKQPPDVEELEGLMKKLKLKPLDFIRKKEDVFREKFAGKNLTDKQWLKAISENPVLLERPIVVQDDHAWIARTDEVLDILRRF